MIESIESAGSGHIFVNDVISWGENTTLTLTATNNIYINEHIEATGDGAGIVLDTGLDAPEVDPGTNPAPDSEEYEQMVEERKDFRESNHVQYSVAGKITLSGSDAKYTVDGREFTVINDAVGLQAIGSSSENLAGYYLLGNDLDMSSGSTFTAIGAGSGTGSNPFTGGFSGGGNVITGLKNRHRTSHYQGLFGSVKEAFVKNIGLESVDIQGADYVGGLVGNSSDSNIKNSYVTGPVTGRDYTGGLIGLANRSAITLSYATGAVNGVNSTGGLIGRAEESTITSSYATGGVTNAGALASASAGGLVGSSAHGINITNSYATGAVTGWHTGGLVGSSLVDLKITNSYASGAVTRAANSFGNLGGLVGSAIGAASITNAFWDGSKNSGMPGVGFKTNFSVNNVKGLTTSKTKDKTEIEKILGSSITNSYTTDDFVWRIYQNQTTPLLQALLSSVNASKKTYDGTKNVDRIMGDLAGSGAGRNVGSYRLNTADLYSTYYDLFGNFELEIERADFTVTDTVISKQYDGTSSAQTAVGIANGQLATGVNGEFLSVSLISAAFTDKNAGARQVQVIYEVANGTNGGDIGNYTLTNKNDTITAAVGIEQRALTVNTTGTTVDGKTYDGNEIAVTTLSNSVDSFTEAQGIVAGETLNLSASGAFLAAAGVGAKDAWSNKTVEVTYTLVDGSHGKGKSSNYILVDATPGDFSATITEKVLFVRSEQIVGTEVHGRDYDGTVAGAATLSDGTNTLAGITGETLALTVSGEFANADAGNPWCGGYLRLSRWHRWHW